MRFINWFLNFFQAPRAVATARRVKFVEGTEWLCPRCLTTIAIARRDIRSGDIAASADWDAKDPAFWMGLKHCGRYLIRFDRDVNRHRIYTPTGWVG